MASKESTAPRYETLHELISRAAALNLTVQVSIHDCPTATALDWLQLQLLDGIEPGAGGNPPTGTMEAGDYTNGKTEVHVFTDGPRLSPEQRAAAIERLAQELETNQALAAELAKHEEEAPEL